MGGGVSKHGAGPPPPTSPTPARNAVVSSHDNRPLSRPNPLSSTEVQLRSTTLTAAGAAAVAPTGGDDMVPRPPSPREQPTGIGAREEETDGQGTNPRRHFLQHHHQQQRQLVQGEASGGDDADDVHEATRADGERSRESSSPRDSDPHGRGCGEKLALPPIAGARPIPSKQKDTPPPPSPDPLVAAPTSSASSPSPDPSPTPHRHHRQDGESSFGEGHGEAKPCGAAAAAAAADPYRPNARSASPATALTTDYGALPLSQLQTELRHNHRVLRVCLTGGPCAGKSTMLAEIQAKIPQRTGYQVYCVPEAATLLVTGGMKWDDSITLEQQLCLLRTQLALEDQFYALAVASGKPTIVMSDRGTMDGRAFCAPEDFAEILRRLGSTVDVLRDRYDAVIHMVTAACGAEQFYNLDNPARYEDLDGARASDQKLQQMYVGHPMFRLLDNSTTFDEKIERGLQLVCRLVGQDGAAMQRTSYFLIRHCPAELPVPSATFRVRTVVLGNSQMDEMRLVQMRVMADGSRMHFFKSVRTARAQPQQQQQLPFPPPPPPTGSSTTAFARRTHGNNNKADDDSASATRDSSASSGGTRQPHGHRPSLTLSHSVRSHSALSVYSTPSGSGNLLGQTTQDHVTSAVRISSKEYQCLVNNKDPQREVVEAETTHFIFGGANFEVTTILAPAWAAGKQTLAVEYDSEEPGGDGSTKAAAAPDIPAFVEVDREVPLDSTTTAFLISHRETGPLYTSLAFAPVFSPQYRGSVVAIGPHADVENFLHSTHSTPKRKPSLRDPNSALERAGKSEAPTAAAAAAPAPTVRGAGPLSERKVNLVAPVADKTATAKSKLKLQTARRVEKSGSTLVAGAGLGHAIPTDATEGRKEGPSAAPPATARHDPTAVASLVDG